MRANVFELHKIFTLVLQSIRVCGLQYWILSFSVVAHIFVGFALIPLVALEKARGFRHLVVIVLLIKEPLNCVYVIVIKS